MLERALAWAEAGWPVFPCDPDTRKPLIKDWQKLATTDQEIIFVWFEKRYPDALPACVPGLADCFVIDVDVKNGKDGEASLATLEAEHDFEAWQYPQQETPSGGRHMFLGGTFRTSVQRALGPGLDTRGGGPDGGLGFIYCYQDDPPGPVSEIPHAPQSLLATSGSTPQKDQDTETPRVELDQAANIERALTLVRGLPPPPEGERNITVFKTAARLKDLGLSLAKVFEVLEGHPSVTGDPPLCEENTEEFNATVRSAYKNGRLAPAIHAVDESAIAEAAAGFDVSPESPAVTRSPRTRLTLWAEERERPVPPWLISDMLPRVSLAGIYGPGGSYKSFIVLDMAMAIASGRPEWAGNRISDPGAPVVYVAGEGSATGRLRAWETLRGVNDEAGKRFVIYHGLDLMDPDQLQGFQEDMESLCGEWGRGPALIAFDTLARAAPGQDENSSKDMGAFVQNADMLKNWARCSVLLVHHTPKKAHEWRGSGAVLNALDAAIGVHRTGEGKARLSMERQKDGPVGRQWDVELEELETGRKYENGDPEKSLVVKTVRPKDTKAQEDRAVVAKQGRAAEVALAHNRSQVALNILKATAGQDATSHTALAGFMAREMGTADPKVLKAWLKGAATNEAHPLYPHVVDRSGGIISFRFAGAD